MITTLTVTTLTAAAPVANHTQLAIAALLWIGVVVALITWLRVHPFLALIIGSAVLGVTAGFGLCGRRTPADRFGRRAVQGVPD